jgi:cell division septum initiation protein DivIVA
VSFCRGSGISKPYSKVELGKKLREIGIEPYKSNDKLKIKVSAKELAQIAKSFNWVHETDEYYDKDSKKNKKQAHPDPSGLDAGLTCEEENDNEEILKKLSDKEKEVQDLNEQFEKMRLEFEAYKKQFPPQGPQAPPAPAPPPGFYELKRAYAQVKEESKIFAEKSRENYKKWYATLSTEEQKKEDERRYNEGATESANREPKTDWAREYESIIKKMERENKIKADQLQNLKEVNFIDEEPPVSPKSPPNILVTEDSDEEESEPEPPKPRPKSKKSIPK